MFADIFKRYLNLNYYKYFNHVVWPRCRQNFQQQLNGRFAAKSILFSLSYLDSEIYNDDACKINLLCTKFLSFSVPVSNFLHA